MLSAVFRLAASYHHMISSADYIFVESSYPRTEGDSGEVVTRAMPPQYKCLQFWYHMTGANMGRLDVYLEEAKSQRQLVWSLAGDRGEYGWHKAVVPLAANTTFRVGDVNKFFRFDHDFEIKPKYHHDYSRVLLYFQISSS